VAAPPRDLVLDLSRFEPHVQGLLAARPDAFIDLRANAYGTGLDLMRTVLGALGATNFLLDDATRSDVDELRAGPGVISGEALLGLAKGQAGFTTFSGTVVNVKRVPAGRRISYGYTYATANTAIVALVALGYADGVLRRASSHCPVRVGTVTGTIAGRVAMDQFVVDLGDADIRPGDTAILWGNPSLGEPSIAQWGRLTGVPSLAIHSGLGPRVTRSYEVSVE